MTTWVSTNELILANTDDLYLTNLGDSNYNALLSLYPPEDRNIYTTNALGEVLSGFSQQKSLLINYLNTKNLKLSTPEIYVRYFLIDDNGNYKYGKWCHAYINMLATGNMSDILSIDGFSFVSAQSDKGLSESEYDYVQSLTDSRLDNDASITINSNGTIATNEVDVDSENLLNNLNNMFAQTKDFMNLFSQVFSFLPDWLQVLIASALGAVCIVGVWKCIRG